MSEPLAVFWTVAARFRGDATAKALVDHEDPRPAEMPVFGSAAPPPAAKQHGLRHKAVAAAIQALLAGAEAIEIFRFPPLPATTKNTTEDATRND